MATDEESLSATYVLPSLYGVPLLYSVTSRYAPAFHASPSESFMWIQQMPRLTQACTIWVSVLSRPVLCAITSSWHTSSQDSLYEPTMLCFMMSMRVLVASSHTRKVIGTCASRVMPSTEDMAVTV